MQYTVYLIQLAQHLHYCFFHFHTFWGIFAIQSFKTNCHKTHLAPRIKHTTNNQQFIYLKPLPILIKLFLHFISHGTHIDIFTINESIQICFNSAYISETMTRCHSFV
nr:hypothetical protein Itr_chr07CG07820 [Ipomoea trifida]